MKTRRQKTKSPGRGGRRGYRQTDESGNCGIKTCQQVVIYTLEMNNMNDSPTHRKIKQKHGKNQRIRDKTTPQERYNDESKESMGWYLW